MAKTSAASTTEDLDERVLLCAGRLFREKGFAATTVREIATAAKMLPGSLHYRFASKDDILVALMRRGVQRVLKVIQSAIVNEQDPTERLRLGLRSYLVQLCDTSDDSLYVLLFDWRSLTPGAKAGVQRQRKRFEDFWDALLLEAHARLA